MTYKQTGENMNLWLDDIREEPPEWNRAYTAEEAIEAIQGGEIEALSLDHDLGENLHGVDVAKWLESEDRGNGNDLWPNQIFIHSSNSVGRENMRRIIESSGRYGRRIPGITLGQWAGIEGFERIR